MPIRQPHHAALRSPCVAVLTTEEVERLSSKNNLFFHEILSAFSVRGETVQFRSGTHLQQLDDFRIRLVKATDMAPRPAALAEKLLQESITFDESQDGMLSWMCVAREGSKGKVVSVTDREQVIQAWSVHDSMDWNKRFRRTLDESLRYVEPELLDCPAVMLLVVSTTNEAPLHCFQELSSTHHWPPVFQSGQFNPQDVENVYVLLHDEVEGAGSLTQAADMFKQLKAAHPGSRCKLLRFNSLGGPAGPPPNAQQADIWLDSLNSLPAGFYESHSPPLRYPPMIPGVRGCCLSADDLLNLREFFAELMIKVVVPAMERRIITLQASVAQARKGVKNFVKSLWRKPREAGDDAVKDLPISRKPTVSLVAYRHDRIEAQIRLLADTYFAMQDYESALSYYKLVRDDFKSDKAWLHLGAVYEMAAVCLHLTDVLSDSRSRRDVEGAVEEAVKAYVRRAEEDALPSSGKTNDPHSAALASVATRLATRISLRGAELLLTSSPHKALEAASLLIAAAKRETPLCSAVLLEEAAWAYLRGNNLRKFACHMCLAGQKLLSCQQNKHSIRCFSSVLATYERASWRHIAGHVHVSLARQFIKLQLVELALYHLLKLLAVGEEERKPYMTFPVAVQEHIIQEMFDLLREYPACLSAIVPYLVDGGGWMGISDRLGKGEEVAYSGSESDRGETMLEGLNLPVVATDTVVVSQSVNEPVGDMVEQCKEELSLELKTAAVLGERGGSMREWVEAMAKIVTEERRVRAIARGVEGASSPEAAYRFLRWRGRREAICVTVEVNNPLDIPLAVSEMQVIASLEHNGLGSIRSGHMGPAAKSALSVQVEPQDLQLAPQERRRVRLQVLPDDCGILRLFGVKWKLFDEVWGCVKFDLSGPLLQNSLQNRATRVRGPNFQLVSQVVSELPLLETELRGVPEMLFQGQVAQGTLRIVNRGLATATQLFVKVNLPSWVFARESSPAPDRQLPQFSLAGSSPSTLRHTSSDGQIGVQMSIVGVSGTVFRIFPGALEPGQELRAPIWIRGLGGGKETLRLLLRYERVGSLYSQGPGKTVDEQEYRYVEVVKDLLVLPSLAMGPSISPSYSVPGGCILSLNVSNTRMDGEHGLRDIELHRIIALSRLWKLEPLSRDLPQASLTILDWQERITLHYRLTPLEREGDLMVYDHELATGEVRCGRGLSQTSDARGPASDPFLEFLYIEHASQAYGSTHHEHRRKGHTILAGAASTAPGRPLSLGEIKRKEAERKAREDANAAATAAAVAGASQVLHVMSSPRVGGACHMGVEGVAPLAVLAPKGRGTINLAVTWTVKGPAGERYRGQHQVLDHAVRPLTLDPTTAAPLTITVELPSRVQGKMGEGGRLVDCKAHVAVTVHNRMTDMPVDFTFEALTMPSGKRQSANQAAASQSFIWLGNTTRTVQSLMSGTSVRLPITACFLRPGVYDLNRFRFVVHMAANSPQLAPGAVAPRLKVNDGNSIRVPYIFSAQYLVTAEANGVAELMQDIVCNVLSPEVVATGLPRPPSSCSQVAVRAAKSEKEEVGDGNTGDGRLRPAGREDVVSQELQEDRAQAMQIAVSAALHLDSEFSGRTADRQADEGLAEEGGQEQGHEAQEVGNWPEGQRDGAPEEGAVEVAEVVFVDREAEELDRRGSVGSQRVDEVYSGVGEGVALPTDEPEQ